MSRIFISHSSKDGDIVGSFISLILSNTLEIPSEDVFCSSVPATGVPIGEDWKSEVAERMKQSEIVVFFYSVNSFESEICLNELGAAWILGLEGSIATECPSGCWLDLKGDSGMVHVTLPTFAIPQKVGKTAVVEGLVSSENGKVSIVGKGVTIK